MIIRQDLKSVSEKSMKDTFYYNSRLLEIRIADKYALDAHEDLRGPLPLAYYIKDISGHWYHCEKHIYDRLELGKRYVLTEYHGIILDYRQELKD